MSVVALPLLAREFTGATGVGLVSAATTAPYLVVSLPGGRLVDGAGRPAAVMRVAFVVAAVAAATSAGVALAGHAGVGSLAGLAFVIGSGRVVTASAVTRLVPATVPPAGVARANATLVAAYALAAVLGPAAAALLVGAVGATVTMLVEAVALGLGATLLPAGLRLSRAASGAGLLCSLPWGSIRPLVANCLSNAAYAGLFSVLVWVVTGRLGLAPWTYGALLGVFGVGSVAGALAAPAFGRRLGEQGLLGAASAMLALGMAGCAASALPRGGTAPVLAAGLAVAGCGVGAFSVAGMTLLMRLTPDHLRGRLGGLVDLATQGVKPFGAVGAGVLADRSGLLPALLGAVVLTLLALLVQVSGRVSGPRRR